MTPNEWFQNHPPVRPAALWLAWVLAGTGGAGLAIAGLYLVMSLLKFDSVAGTALLALVLLAVLTSAAQLAVLTRVRPLTAGWFLASLAGWFTGAAISLSLGQFSSSIPLPMLVLMGGCLGLAQWVILKNHFSEAELWLPASVLGWTALGLATSGGFSIPQDLLLLGLVPAIFTGTALVYMTQKSFQARNPSANRAP